MQKTHPQLMTLLANHRVQTLLALLAILLLTMIVFFDTWQSITDIWIRSDTFTHGFLVIPASIWLVWQNKKIHPYLFPSGQSMLGFCFILLNGFMWLLSSLTQTLVLQQYGLVGMLIGSIWFYLGNKTVKKLLFPLCFIYFMIPVGEFLFPYLMEYTATFTIDLLRFSGLNVYREGMHFTLVSGQWSVVEACSGLRYLIASFTLGIIYAYVNYTQTYKRVLFTLFSIVLPIVANGFRAYLIVIIGHLSDMTLAVGVDHIVYGALFFGIIIFFMFYVGSYWKDPLPDTEETLDPLVSSTTYSVKKNSILAFVTLCSLSLWPYINNQLQSNYHAQTNIPEWPQLTQNTNWQKIAPPYWEWQPQMDGTVSQSIRYFKNQKNIVALYQANFGGEAQGSKLITSQNTLIHFKDHKKWHSVEESSISPINSLGPVDFVRIRNNQLKQDFITLKWYKIGQYNTNNIYMAKLHQLFKRLTLNTETETFNILFFKATSNLDTVTMQNIIKQLNNQS